MDTARDQQNRHGTVLSGASNGFDREATRGIRVRPSTYSKAKRLFEHLLPALAYWFSLLSTPASSYLHSIERPLEMSIEIEGDASTHLRIAPRSYVQATIHQRGSNTAVGVHLKGNYGTFQGIQGKPSLTLNFSKFRTGQTLQGMDKIHLNNSVSDPTLMTEKLCHELFQKGGLATARTGHARVDLNGRALGLYVLVEGYGKGFLKDHFAVAHGNLYDSEFRHDVTEPLRRSHGKGPNDRMDLATLARAAQEPEPGSRLKSVATALNLDEFYSFIALESMTCHFDGYARSINNYWLYHNPETDKFVFLPYGMDQMFRDPESSLFPELQGSVARAVLGTTEGRKQYRERCRRLFNLFPPLTNRIDELYATLRPEIAKDGTNDVPHFERAVQELRDRVTKRIAHLRKHLFAPDPSLLNLNPSEQLLVTNWLWSIEEGSAKMTAETIKGGANLLRSQFENSEKASVATWESRLLLPKGSYLIVARAACNEPVFRGPSPPALLRVWGGTDLGAQSICIDSKHLDLLHPLRIDSDQEEILLQCQLRSSGQPVTYEVCPVIIRRLE